MTYRGPSARSSMHAWTYSTPSARPSLLLWTYNGPSARSGLFLGRAEGLLHGQASSHGRTDCPLHGQACFHGPGKRYPPLRENVQRFGCTGQALSYTCRCLDVRGRKGYFGLFKPNGQTVVCTVRTSGAVNVRIERHRESQT